MSNLINSFFEFIIDMFATVIQIVLVPVNILFNTIMPDNIQNIISSINNAIFQFALLPINFFVHLIPPTALSLLILSLTILISYYSIRFVYYGIVLIPHLIKKLKFW